MLSKHLPLSVALPQGAPARQLAVVVLHRASLFLGHLARQLHRVEQPAAEPVLEFHADAGAPEGALYVDGRLVALLPGVNRL